MLPRAYVPLQFIFSCYSRPNTLAFDIRSEGKCYELQFIEEPKTFGFD